MNELDAEDDLVLCHQEPIRTPGSIQPHGALIAYSASTSTVETVSENLLDFLGVDTARALRSQIEDLLSPTSMISLKKAITTLKPESPTATFELGLEIKSVKYQLDAAVHRVEDKIVLEIDNLRPELATDTRIESNPLLAMGNIQSLVMKLHHAKTLLELCTTIAEQVTALTGFDRVMVYRFHPDNHGEVVAENLSVDWPSYLGLHFPETDIPAQARELYKKNWLRCITAAPYDPVKLVSAGGTDSLHPIDLSLCALRSVSPIHIEYLQNMGVGASMSISIMDDDKLWGLVACHNKTSKYVDFTTRTSCELLGTTFSLLLLSLESAEQSKNQIEVQDIERQLLNKLAEEPPFADGVFNHLPDLSDLVHAHGSASIAGETVRTSGKTPSEPQIAEFGKWLQTNDVSDVYVSECICEEYEPASNWDSDYSGVLVIEIAKSRRQYLVCFRPEFKHTANWAGNPDKVVVSDGGVRRLSPRKSFEIWQENVERTSRPWLPIEVKSAQSFRQAALHLIIETAEQITRLNRELSRSNDSLQAFAHVAAHDLKEPLRGIHNYASFIRDDHGADLDAEAVRKLDAITNLAARGNALTISLLEYAEIGGRSKNTEWVSLSDIVDSALEVLQPIVDQKCIKVRKPANWPRLYCNSVELERVFANLLSNALKHVSETDRWVEVGFLSQAEQALNENISQDCIDNNNLTLYVRDNGIGIPAGSLTEIFNLFKRLHPRHFYDGGSGMGLAIVKRIIESLNGEIWAESELGSGSTFYFTVGIAEYTDKSASG